MFIKSIYEACIVSPPTMALSGTSTLEEKEPHVMEYATPVLMKDEDDVG